MLTFVVSTDPIGEQAHELLERQRRAGVFESPVRRSAAAGVERETAQERPDAGEVKALDLSLLRWRVGSSEAEVDIQRGGCGARRVGAELKPVIDAEPFGDPADCRVRNSEEHPVAQRCKNLGCRWPQRDRPPHNRPRVPVDEHRRPRPDRPPGPRWDDQHVELLVIALPHLVAMAGLPAHIQAMRADPGLASSCRRALRWPQLPHERPLQRPQ